MKRRTFFSKLAAAAGIVALAPQLAFRVRPEIPSIEAQKAFVQTFFFNKPINKGYSFWYTPTLHSERLSREYKEVFKKVLGALNETS